VTIHAVSVPEACDIGEVRAVSGSDVQLLEITPDARSFDKPTPCALKDITRVDFGSAYRRALGLADGCYKAGADHSIPV
jgi:hypothetical protein